MLSRATWGPGGLVFLGLRQAEGGTVWAKVGCLAVTGALERCVLTPVQELCPIPPEVKKGTSENVQFLKAGSCFCFLL